MLVGIPAGEQVAEGEIIITKGLNSPETIKSPEKGQLMRTLHALGSDGWEAVTMGVHVGGTLTFLLKKAN